MTRPERWQEITAAGRLLASAGLAPGTTGNISVLDDNVILTSGTGTRLGLLTDADWSEISRTGEHLRGAPPTKEAMLHAAVYRRRPDVGAIVHLHSPAALAVSCLARLATVEPLPAYTPYFVMRVRGLGCVEYFPPGDPRLGDAVAETLASADAALLRRHGLVTAGTRLTDALSAAEELETNCDLHLRLSGHETSPLTAAEIAALRA